MSDRNPAPQLGARFWMEDGVEMFQFVADANSVIGPRPATERDHEQHPDANTEGGTSSAHRAAEHEQKTRPKDKPASHPHAVGDVMPPEQPAPKRR